LNLDRCFGIRNDELIELSKSLKWLATLNVGALSHLTDASLIALATYSTELENLNISGWTQCTPSALLRIVKNCPNLQGKNGLCENNFELILVL
jgi:hypothetical protein